MATFEPRPPYGLISLDEARLVSVVCSVCASQPKDSAQAQAAYYVLAARRNRETGTTTTTDEDVAQSVPRYAKGGRLLGRMTAQSYGRTTKKNLKAWGLVDFQDGRKSRTATTYTFPAFKRLLEGVAIPELVEQPKQERAKTKPKPGKGRKAPKEGAIKAPGPTCAQGQRTGQRGDYPTNEVITFNGNHHVSQVIASNSIGRNHSGLGTTNRLTDKNRLRGMEEGSNIPSPRKQNHHVSGQSAPSCPNCQRPLSSSWKSGGLEWWRCPCGWHGNLSDDIQF